jgi:hypothetical protein
MYILGMSYTFYVTYTYHVDSMSFHVVYIYLVCHILSIYLVYHDNLCCGVCGASRADSAATYLGCQATDISAAFGVWRLPSGGGGGGSERAKV